MPDPPTRQPFVDPNKTLIQKMFGIKTDAEVAADLAARQKAMENIKNLPQQHERSEKGKQMDEMMREMNKK